MPKRKRLADFYVLAIELNPLRSVPLIHLQSICELNLVARAKRRILHGAADVAEGNRLQRRRARRASGRGALAKLQFQVPPADDPRIGDPEIRRRIPAPGNP